MVQTLVNLAVKFSGLGWLWAKLDGLKTYVAAAMVFLPGLAAGITAAVGILGELSPMLAAHNAGAVYAWAQHLATDPNWVALKAAWLTMGGGLAILGLGHKLEKAVDVPVSGVEPKA